MYTFTITAKRTIGNQIPKGLSVTYSNKSGATPSPKQILAAYEEQHGIIVKNVEVAVGYFIIEKLK